MTALNKKFVRKIVQLFFHGIFRAHCPVTFEGVEHLPKNEAFILCANQSSHLDLFSLVFASNRSINDFVAFTAQDHLSHTWFNQIKKAFLPCLVDFFPIERNAGNQFNWSQLIDDLKHHVNHKKILTLFPDGTRTKTGNMNPFKPGISYFAHQLNVPVIPAYIHGTYHCLPYNKTLPRRGKITIAFGAPRMFNKQQSQKAGHAAAYQHFAESLFQDVVALRQLTE